MPPAYFSLIFVIFLVLQFAIKTWLNIRQVMYISKHAHQVPDGFSEFISPEDHLKSARYALDKIKISQFELLYETIILLGFTLMGGIELLSRFVAPISNSGIVQGLLLMLCFYVIQNILSLPFSLFRTFKLEARYGFNRMTPALFIRDFLTSMLLSIVIGGIVLSLIFWIMSASDYWWLWAWLLTVAFSALMMYVAPTWLMPLFNKFTPLEDGELKHKIQQLAQRCNFALSGIFVMDSSKHSSHGNAFFTGFGKNRRIVFFDTLINRLTPQELESVMAHELGHFKHKHVIKRMILMMAASLIFFLVLYWLSVQDWFYEGLGVSSHHQGFWYAQALLLAMLVVPIFTFWLTPLNSYLSRRDEFEADAFAASKSDASELVSALLKLYRDNAGSLTTDPVYSAYYYSHPPATERIAHLKALAA